MRRDEAAADGQGVRTFEASPRPAEPVARIPAPPPALTTLPIAVGTYPARSVEAEDFARRIGNWGTAARDIGDRWEVVGVDRLRRRLPWTLLVGGGRAMHVVRILRLDSGEAGAALQRAGVSAPDLLLVGTIASGAGPRVVVRAADLKVSLDTAERMQTAPTRLQAMFARVAGSMPVTRDAILAEARAQDHDDPVAERAVVSALAGEWTDLGIVEGLFIAPDTGFNRWFLQEVEHRRRTGRGAPRLPFGARRRGGDGADLLGLPAHLEAVPPAEFLGTLDGWREAQVIARLDCTEIDAVDPAVAERFWRVGNGLRAALLAVRRRMFEPSSDALGSNAQAEGIDPIVERVAARAAGHSEAVVREVASLLEGRRASWDVEARVLAFPVGYDTWSEHFAEARRTADGAAGDGDEAAGDGNDAPDPDLQAILSAVERELGPDAPSPEDEARRMLARSCRHAHRAATQRHRARVIAAAREAYDAGLDERATLGALRARHVEWVALALADATPQDHEGEGADPPASTSR